MNVTCPACAARYTADEHKLRGKTARMRCRHCDTVWLVSGPPADDVADDVTAARIRRGSDRDARDRADLFAPRPSDPGVVRQTLRPAPPQDPRDETVPPPGASAANGTAARHENSVLFTLAGLTQDPRAARLKTPEPERTPMAQTPSRAEDDEGIIDLKALASVPPRAGARPAVAPLFSEPPPAAFAVDADASDLRPAVAPAAKSSGARRVVTIVGALAAVAVAGLGLAYAFKGEKPAPVAAAMPAPPPPPAVVAPPPPAQPDPVPAASSSAASDDAKTTTTAKGAKKGAKGKAGARAKATTEATAAPKAPKPAAAADPCGCKGDFNCVLACTVKKGK